MPGKFYLEFLSYTSNYSFIQLQTQLLFFKVQFYFIFFLVLGDLRKTIMYPFIQYHGTFPLILVQSEGGSLYFSVPI